MARPSCKASILEAAERVVVRDGAAHLTLDAVAEEAGLSKGGVLYHFPSKSALLEGMLEALLSYYAAQREAAAQQSEEQGRYFRAELAAGLPEKPNQSKRLVGNAILAVIANEPRLIDQCRAFHEERYKQSCGNDLQDLDRLSVILAMDGLIMLELLQISPFTPDQRERIREHLVETGKKLLSRE